MTGSLVGVTVLQPADGTVVLPGESVTCSGRATGHGGLQTTLVDSVVLSLDRGTDVEADLSPVVPKPAVPAVNWAASITAPGQPGPHDLTITAFPDDGGAPASVTVGFTVQEPARTLTGVWECDDGGLYYLRQGPDRSVIWAGLHDSGFHKGLDFTNVFHGWLSPDGGALAGDWSMCRVARRCRVGHGGGRDRPHPRCRDRDHRDMGMAGMGPDHDHERLAAAADRAAATSRPGAASRPGLHGTGLVLAGLPLPNLNSAHSGNESATTDVQQKVFTNHLRVFHAPFSPES